MVVGDNFLLVSISGITNGGKTTLATRLLETFPHAKRLNQDVFFFPEDDPRHVWLTTDTFHHQNWEIPSSIDFVKLKQELLAMTATDAPELPYRLVILDGHILFSDADLAAWSDRKYFFTLTRDQCWDRRTARVYDPPDPPGYFDACIYPEYLKHKAFVEKHVKDLHFIDGATNREEIFASLVDDIRNLIAEQQPCSPKPCSPKP